MFQLGLSFSFKDLKVDLKVDILRSKKGLNIMKKLIYVWIILMIAGIFTAGTAFVCVQQSLRSSANGPAIAAAQEVQLRLHNGVKTEDAIDQKTDISTTLLPFEYIYDNNKKLIATSASFGSESFTYPQGVLDSINKNGECRITWQPKSGLRFATVGIKFDGGYIVGCSSLSESEKTTQNISILLLFGSAVYAVGCAMILLIFKKVYNKK
jgi:hypothetical protein